MTRPPFYQTPFLAEMDDVSHGFFGRQGGVSTGLFESLNVGIGSEDDPAAISINRETVRTTLGLPAMVSAYQVHSADVITVTEPWPDDQRPRGDAMVTDRPGIGLCILTADCVPVLFADIRLSVIGAVHAGWKGAIGGVCEATLEAMAAFGSRPRDIICSIGPAIQQPSYEVGPEFADRFIADDPDNRTFFRPGAGDRLHFDLTGYVHRRLARAGIGQIEHLSHDTCADERYFSNRRRTHRGEADYGRNASVIAISL